MQEAEQMILRDLYGTDKMHAVFDDRALVQCWLDVEAALARAEAQVGLIPHEAAEEITLRARADLIDLHELRVGTNLVGYPILPLVRQLSALCEGGAAGYIHWGATTQDIMDTACVLQLRSAEQLLTEDLGSLIERLSSLARRHRDTVMVGRTHGQHALPITFGYKLAVWVDELRRHAERLEQVTPRLFRLQFGGASGTLAALGQDGLAVHRALALELGLAPANIAWHSARDTLAEFIAICALLAASLGKMANEVATLQRTEIGEVEEGFAPGKGGSSTMPQKRNPNLSENVVGLARLIMQQVPAALAAMMPEHERAMGEWHIEWHTIPQTCLMTSAALSHTLTIFQGLAVNKQSMERNLHLTQGQVVAEALMMRLAESMGRQHAHDLLYALCLESTGSSTPLRALILEDRRVNSLLSEEELEELLNPKNYTGLSAQLVDAVAGTD